MKFLQKTIVAILSIAFLLGIAVSVSVIYAQDPQTEYQKKKEEYEREKARIEAENKKKAESLEEQKRITAAKKAYNDGTTYLKKGMADEALKSYELSIQYDNNFSLAYHGKGLALVKLRRYDEAIAAYQKSVMLNPLYADGFLALAKLYRDLNRDDEALTMCLEAIKADTISGKTNPNDLASAYYELGFIHNERKEFLKAADAFAEVGKLDPKHYRSFNAQAAALEKIGKTEEAIVSYQKAVEIKPNYYEAYGRMAALYNKLGQYENGRDAALNSLKNKKDYALAAFEAGTAYKSLGQMTNAIQYFDIASKDRAWTQSAQWEIDMIKRKMK